MAPNVSDFRKSLIEILARLAKTDTPQRCDVSGLEWILHRRKSDGKFTKVPPESKQMLIDFDRSAN